MLNLTCSFMFNSSSHNLQDDTCDFSRSLHFWKYISRIYLLTINGWSCSLDCEGLLYTILFEQIEDLLIPVSPIFFKIYETLSIPFLFVSFPISCCLAFHFRLLEVSTLSFIFSVSPLLNFSFIFPMSPLLSMSDNMK